MSVLLRETGELSMVIAEDLIVQAQDAAQIRAGDQVWRGWHV